MKNLSKRRQAERAIRANPEWSTEAIAQASGLSWYLIDVVRTEIGLQPELVSSMDGKRHPLRIKGKRRPGITDGTIAAIESAIAHLGPYRGPSDSRWVRTLRALLRDMYDAARTRAPFESIWAEFMQRWKTTR